MQPLLPDFGGACLTGVVPGVLGSLYRGEAPPAWMPDPVGQGSQVVLLVLDGLGWQQLAERRPISPRTRASPSSSASITIFPPRLAGFTRAIEPHG